MKRALSLCLTALIWFVTQKNTQAFVAWGNEPDSSNQNHLGERLAFIESTLGIQHAWYNYSIPSDKKLIATVTCTINGKKSESVFQVTPFKDSKPTDSQICLTLLTPSECLLNHANAFASVRFFGNKRMMASFSFTVPSAAIQGNGGASMKNNLNSPPLDQTNAIKAFDVVVWDTDAKESFGFQLAVKFVGLEPTDKMGSMGQIRGNGEMPIPPIPSK